MIYVNNEKVALNRFPDGTLNIKGNPSLNNGTVIITWKYHDDTEFMAVAFLTKYYQAHGNIVTLFMPYVPNARMDRVENAEDIFTMKYFGEMINSLNFDKVFVMDVHSSVTTAVIRNVHFVPVNTMVNKVIDMVVQAEDEIPLIFFPDEGSMKRYSKGFCIPFAYGMKKRDWQTGQILGLDILGINPDTIKGKPVLIRDDICSKGGTFYYAAKKLKEMGAGNIYLLVTHCEESIHYGTFGEGQSLQETGLIKHVFTTDSVYDGKSCDWISVIATNLSYGHLDTENCGCKNCGECKEVHE